MYDADLVEGDLDQAKADIRQLNAEAQSASLIVIGGRAAVASLQGSKSIWPLVKRWVKKPITASQLLMAVSAINSDHASAAKKSKSKLTSIGVGALAAVLVVASIVYVVFSGSEHDSQASLDQISIEGGTSPTLEQNQINEASENALEIERLSRLAVVAQDKGQLISPEGQNALGYYNQILEFDKYHAQAYEQKWNIIKQLRDSFPKLLEAGEFEQASKALYVLVETEPFSGENNSMRLALEKAQKPFKVEPQNDEQVADETDEPVVTAADFDQPNNVDAENAIAKQQAVAESKKMQQAVIKMNQQAQSLSAIESAMNSGKLIPPQAQNAYSLLFDSVKKNSIDDSALIATRSRLGDLLIQRAKQETDKPNLAVASNYINYLQKLDGRHQALPTLIASLQQKRAQINVAKSKAAVANNAKSASETKPAAVIKTPNVKANAAGSTAKITPYRIIKRAKPKYPRRAYNLDIEGWVKLAFQVDASGKAVNIEVVKSEPRKMFNKSAIEALEAWEFTPAKNAATGEAVMSEKTDTQFNFALGG